MNWADWAFVATFVAAMTFAAAMLGKVVEDR